MCFSKKIKNPVEAVGVVQSCQRSHRSTRRFKDAGLFDLAQRYVYHFKTFVRVEGLENPLLSKDVLSRETVNGQDVLFINDAPMQMEKRHIRFAKEGGMWSPGPYETGDHVLVVYDAKKPKKCRIKERVETKKK